MNGLTNWYFHISEHYFAFIADTSSVDEFKCIMASEKKKRLKRLDKVLFFYMTFWKKGKTLTENKLVVASVRGWDWLAQGMRKFFTVTLYLDYGGLFTNVCQKSQSCGLKRVNFTINNNASINLGKRLLSH